MANGTDLDGEAWATAPSIGCDEFSTGAVTGAVSVAIQPDSLVVAVGTELGFKADIMGRLSTSRWELGGSTIVSNRPLVSYTWRSTGNFPVVLRAYNESYPNGISTTVTVKVVSQPVYYVSQRNMTPLAPYTSWVTAATNIQGAVDAATIPGSLVLVSNGVFATGARLVFGALSNRLAVTKPLTILSLNGPAVTTIQGYQVPGTIVGSAAVRCAFLGPGVVLSGFTLTSGATALGSGSSFAELDGAGGGFYSAAPTVVISNCIIGNNAAYAYGGGGRGGTLAECLVISNVCTTGDGGGCYGSAVGNSALAGNSGGRGGATYGGVLNDCDLLNNLASCCGGGSMAAILSNCLLSGNSAKDGGGALGSTLFNCTLTNNAAWNEGGGGNSCNLSNCLISDNSAYMGGGVYQGTARWTTLRSNTATNCGGGAVLAALSNCTITQNRVGTNGGGTYMGSATNCAIVGNSVMYQGGGGGSDGTFLQNCTVTGNRAKVAGGTRFGELRNCLVYYNEADEQPSWGNAPWGSTPLIEFCCTTPQPTNGTGNFTTDPQLASEFHLSSTSPCRMAGSAAWATGFDIDGETWASRPAVGCDESGAGAITGDFRVGIRKTCATVAVGFPVDFVAQVDGRVSDSRWEFGDGLTVSNRAFVSHAWTVPGNYPVVLRAYNESSPGGISATTSVQVLAQPVHYVNAASLNAMPPYTTWSTAASNIQDAVDAAAVPGALVLVSNGVYAMGACRANDSWSSNLVSNRVSITKPIMVRSLNGPDKTVIQGDTRIRSVYMTNQSALAGFTLTNGLLPIGMAGGGVWCESYSSVVSNCILAGNTAHNGGGAYFGTIDSCALSGNQAYYGGAQTRADSTAACSPTITQVRLAVALIAPS